MIIELDPRKWFPKRDLSRAKDAKPTFVQRAPCDEVSSFVGANSNHADEVPQTSTSALDAVESQTAQAKEKPMSTTPVVIAKPSIFERIEAKLKLWAAELVKDEPKVEVIALSTIDVLAPLAATILEAVDPAAALLISPIVQEVQAGLAALTVTIEDVGSQPTIQSVVASIQANLAQIEAAAGIKSTQATTLIGQITTELNGIVDELFPAAPATTTLASAA